MTGINLKETFEKQGGMKLLKQYWQSGTFFLAVGEFLLLGKSRTALEILRLSTQFKTKLKLEKKYRADLQQFDKSYDSSLPHEFSDKVWVCWFQGLANAPEVVRKCYQSIVDNLADREVVLITSKNMYDYIRFPVYIQEKIDHGIISGAHLSDLLRLELLLRYGGTWIDSTVLCTSSEVPKYMLESELFMFQCMKPGRDGHTTTISNWFITAASHNHLLWLTQQLLYDYWKENNKVMDYFIFHQFFQIVIEAFPEEWSNVVPCSNSTPHIILLRLFEKYDGKIWDAVRGQTPFHKLSYKYTQQQTQKEGTYYRCLLDQDMEAQN